MKTQQTLDDMMREVGPIESRDTALINTFLQPIDAASGEEEVGALNVRQTHLFIVICLLKIRRKEKENEYKTMTSKHDLERGESEEPPDINRRDHEEKETQLADEIDDLDWKIHHLEEIFWSTIKVDFFNIKDDPPRNQLRVGWYYILIRMKPRKKGGVLRMSLSKALETILRHLRFRHSADAQHACKSKV